jgi:hypothetical protein
MFCESTGGSPSWAWVLSQVENPKAEHASYNLEWEGPGIQLYFIKKSKQLIEAKLDKN